jgi:hypothetical protein
MGGKNCGGTSGLVGLGGTKSEGLIGWARIESFSKKQPNMAITLQKTIGFQSNRIYDISPHIQVLPIYTKLIAQQYSIEITTLVKP